MTSILIPALVLFVVVLFVVLSSFRMVPERRRLAVTRLGRFAGLAGPGLAVIVPAFDRGVPIEVGQEGLLLEDGTCDFGSGIFLKVEPEFVGHKAGSRVRITRFEGAGASSRIVVGRAA
jgi:regulator of protease activity HflC (stomatin/prohibitin superfamily)